ncbi:sensor histidine kinase [Marivivens aquimaris]|uniref:sensor histidine kinase n=1 Tax=Marivivens aquimaris TaxID=2774876 RepID=UPI00187FC7A4|nr:histidine kinase dimerization/phosphoacceptor domain -containing protein [Marivivens aquimaris]
MTLPHVGTPEARATDAGIFALFDGSQEIVMAMLAASQDCIKVLSLEGVLEFMSYGGMCAMEIPDYGMVAGKFWWDLWPVETRDVLKAAVASAAKGTPVRLTAFCPTAGGTDRWWEVTVAPVPDKHGDVTRVLSISRDVTEIVKHTKELEEQKSELEEALETSKLLRREVDHRVKNSLGLVSSLLRLQSRRAPADAKAALEVAAGRVNTIGRVHDMLHRLENVRMVDVGQYLNDLCVEVCRSLRAAGQAETEIKTIPLKVDPSTAISIGLAVTEIVTNSIRHGQMPTDGRISLNLEDDGDTIHLTVADNGKGLPEGFDLEAGGGVGMQVVRSMVSQMEGKITAMRSDNGGARFDISFPRPSAA